MRWLTIAAAVAALALGLAAAGCGGGDDESSDEPDATLTETETDATTDETTTEETSSDETSTEEETDTDAGSFASGDCQELVNASSAIGEALSGANTPDEVEAASDRFHEFADQVPEEIQDDVQVLADVYDKYISVIADIDLQPGETPSAEQIAQLTAALRDIDQQAVTEASTNLSTGATENC
jgi:uncharacterized protein YceH (UPF0502 family)